MKDDGGRLALLTEEHLEVLLTEVAVRAATQVLDLSQPERGLKVSEVADRLSCAESTVYGLVERGALRAVRLGSAIRVLESALNDWIRAQARTNVPNPPLARRTTEARIRSQVPTSSLTEGDRAAGPSSRRSTRRREVGSQLRPDRR